MAKTKPPSSTASRGASAAPQPHQRTGNRIRKNIRNTKKNALRKKMREEKRKSQAKVAKAKTDEQKTEANDAKNMNNTTKTHPNNDQASAVQKTNREKKAARRAAKRAAKNAAEEVQTEQDTTKPSIPQFRIGNSLVMVDANPQLDAGTIAVLIDAYQTEIDRLRALEAMMSKVEENAATSSP